MENMLSNLERMAEPDFKVVLNYSALKDKMSLRASSTTLRRRVDKIENTFKVWRIGGLVDSAKLRRISDEIKIIKGKSILNAEDFFCQQLKGFCKNPHSDFH